MMRRAMPAALGLVFALVPLFPSFIALAGVQFPGISLLPQPLTLAVLAVCAWLAIYALLVLSRYPAKGSQPLLAPLLAIFGAGLVAGCLGFNPVAGLLFTGIGGLGIIWHCSIMRFYSDRYAALSVFAAYLASGTLAGAAAIAMAIARVPAAQYVAQHGRATGAFILPGELAGYFIVFLPIAYTLARSGVSPGLRVLARAGLLVGLAAIGLSYSRAGWIGGVAAFAFLFAVRARRGAAIAVVVAGALAVLVLFNAHHDPSEDYTRLSIWRAAVQIADRYPLTGVGPFNFSRVYPLVRAPDGDPSAFHAHSLYLTFLAEFGIVGASAVLWTMWRFATELRRRVATAPAPDALLALSVTAGLFGVAVQGLIDTVSVVIFGLWFPMLALALAAAKGGEPSPTTG
ncbi:MAG TPA: O-antigen ligase family protein [Candidatus Babeliales bacterium]|nr:O-antigen ligase family protein [Candidatus Babeliales bacterium]